MNEYKPGHCLVSLSGTGDVYHLIPVEELIERQRNTCDIQERMIRRSWKLRERREELKQALRRIYELEKKAGHESSLIAVTAANALGE